MGYYLGNLVVILLAWPTLDAARRDLLYAKSWRPVGPVLILAAFTLISAWIVWVLDVQP